MPGFFVNAQLWDRYYYYYFNYHFIIPVGGRGVLEYQPGVDIRTLAQIIQLSLWFKEYCNMSLHDTVLDFLKLFESQYSVLKMILSKASFSIFKPLANPD